MAYSDASGKYKRKSGKASNTTTGAVAEILEAQYHVMEIFYESRKEKIDQWLAEAVQDQIDDIVAGHRSNRDPFDTAMGKIEVEFRAFLDADEISAVLPLTQQIAAAQIGVNHRKKSGFNKNNEARAAFVDTGLYSASMRSWISGKMG
jgi:hypothetical protein